MRGGYEKRSQQGKRAWPSTGSLPVTAVSDGRGTATPTLRLAAYASAQELPKERTRTYLRMCICHLQRSRKGSFCFAGASVCWLWGLPFHVLMQSELRAASVLRWSPELAPPKLPRQPGRPPAWWEGKNPLLNWRQGRSIGPGWTESEPGNGVSSHGTVCGWLARVYPGSVIGPRPRARVVLWCNMHICRGWG